MPHDRSVDRRFRVKLEPLEGRELMSRGLGAPPSEAAAGEVRPRTESPRYGISRTASDVVYARSGAKLDVYRPTGGEAPEGGFPAIVALPGGGWREVDRGNYGAAVASAFVPAGYVVVPADYLYAASSGGRAWPANIRDVRDAIRYVRKNAAALGVNPDKIVVSGESAGGHLAALAGTLPEGAFAPDARRPKLVDGDKVSGKPNAVVAFYAPTDLLNEWQIRGNARPYLTTFLGDSPRRARGLYQAASPRFHVTPDDAPTFLAQGTADNVIPVSQTEAYDQALKDAGVKQSLSILTGQPHGFRFFLKQLNLAAEIQTFLDSVWTEQEKARA